MPTSQLIETRCIDAQHTTTIAPNLNNPTQWHSGDPKLLSRSMGGHYNTSLIATNTRRNLHSSTGRRSSTGAPSSPPVSPDPDQISNESDQENGGAPAAGVTGRLLPMTGRRSVASVDSRGGGSESAAAAGVGVSGEEASASAAAAAVAAAAAAAAAAAEKEEKTAKRRAQRRHERQLEQLHAPTVVLVAVDEEHHGWLYGEYWHHLLRGRGLLALGLYRPVRQQGQRFDCVTTHVAPVSGGWGGG